MHVSHGHKYLQTKCRFIRTPMDVPFVVDNDTSSTVGPDSLLAPSGGVVSVNEGGDARGDALMH